MMLFALCFAALCATAAGLALGALRGRPLAPGPCRQAALAGGLLPRCGGCAEGAEARGSTRAPAAERAA